MTDTLNRLNINQRYSLRTPRLPSDPQYEELRKTLPNDLRERLFEYVESLETGRNWRSLTAEACGRHVHRTLQIADVRRLADLRMLAEQGGSVSNDEQWNRILEHMRTVRRLRSIGRPDSGTATEALDAIRTYETILELALRESQPERLKLLHAVVRMLMNSQSTYVSGPAIDFGEYLGEKAAGNDALAASFLTYAENSLKELKNRLYPALSEEEQTHMGDLVGRYLSKMVSGSPKTRVKTFLELCDDIIQNVASAAVTPLQAASRLRHFLDYSELMAEIRLHPLLIAASELEMPGSFVTADPTVRWMSFVQARTSLV